MADTTAHDASGEPRGLPWERAGGAAADVGICLSGGGLRAASFALGVLQVLQEERHLLFGPATARYLSAVSGGSYVAAAHAVGATALAPLAATGVRPPLALGSPEEDHILDHGRYLVQPPWRTGLRFGALVGLNFVALIVLFVWSGTMLGDVATISAWPSWTTAPLHTMHRVPVAVLIVGFVVAIFVVVGGLYSGSQLVRYLLPIPGLIGLAVFTQPVLRDLDGNSWLSASRHWVVVLAIALAILVVTATGGFLMQRAQRVGVWAAAANWGQIAAVRAVGGVLLLWSGLTWYRLLRTGTADAATTRQAAAAGIGLAASLVLGLAFSYVPDRASLHREYRNRIRSCFGVVRNATGGVEPIEPNTMLSELSDAAGAGTGPQLLICATANVRNRLPGGALRAYAPFVLARDRCGVPGTDATFATAKLELGRVAGGFLAGKEPLVSVFTAVAMTGAAVSPSMGRKTLASARPVLAALNIRLGRWLPNPFNARMRRRVAALVTPGPLYGRKYRDQRMGPGYDELIPEMLGLSGPSVYISDGGHFDNLGLLALVRARCAEIWCVDSSPDKAGAAVELRRVLDVAEAELGTTATVDLERFAADANGDYGTAHIHGRLDYGGGASAELHVVKLGLTSTSPATLHSYRTADRGFPHHPTLVQWYPRARIVAYRDLGRDSTKAAIMSAP